MKNLTSLVIAIVVGLLISSCGEEPAKKPNILVIFSDDHAYQAISAYGYGIKQYTQH